MSVYIYSQSIYQLSIPISNSITIFKALATCSYGKEHTSSGVWCINRISIFNSISIF